MHPLYAKASKLTGEIIAAAIEVHRILGPVNLASPNPLPYAEFMRELRSEWGIRLGLPAAVELCARRR